MGEEEEHTGCGQKGEKAQEMWAGERSDALSVMLSSVPSAPMKSFVVSNPVLLLRDRRCVLTTSPLGSTTIYSDTSKVSSPATQDRVARGDTQD